MTVARSAAPLAPAAAPGRFRHFTFLNPLRTSDSATLAENLRFSLCGAYRLRTMRQWNGTYRLASLASLVALLMVVSGQAAHADGSPLQPAVTSSAGDAGPCALCVQSFVTPPVPVFKLSRLISRFSPSHPVRVAVALHGTGKVIADRSPPAA
jgi:hypothetical protein